MVFALCDPQESALPLAICRLQFPAFLFAATQIATFEMGANCQCKKRALSKVDDLERASLPSTTLTTTASVDWHLRGRLSVAPESV